MEEEEEAGLEDVSKGFDKKQQREFPRNEKGVNFFRRGRGVRSVE